MKRYSLDALETKRLALDLTIFLPGLLLALSYPLAFLPVWARVIIAALVYSVGVYTDYSSTKWAVSRFGVEVEGNLLYRFTIRRFGLALGFLVTDAFLIGFVALMAYHSFPSFPDYLLVALLVAGFSHLGAGLGNWLVINAHRARKKEQV